MPAETCAECRFDAEGYGRRDLLGTLRVLSGLWRETIAGIDDDMLTARPAPDVWSALEYAAHSRDVTGAMDFLVDLALTEDHPQLPPVPDTPAPILPTTIHDAIAALDTNASRLFARLAKLPEDQWQRDIVIGENEVDVQWILGHAVHDSTHHLRDIARGFHALGAGAPTQHGTLVQINSSDGGVPKQALTTAVVGARGVVGDRQADRKHHGRPLQALSLWSLDVIEALQGEGHPVHAGAAGENLTLAGIDWTTIRPGVRLRIGDVLVEISAYATPCAKNAQWFSDGDFHRIDNDDHPGWSRAYAWVLDGGSVSAGDEVVVEPG